MSYKSIAELTADVAFKARLSAAITVEAIRKDDRFSPDLLRMTPAQQTAMFGAVVAATEGFGAKYEQGGNTAITDDELLVALQNNWKRVATMYGRAGAKAPEVPTPS